MVRSYILGDNETLLEWSITLIAGYLAGRFMWKLINGDKWITWAANTIRSWVGLPRVE